LAEGRLQAGGRALGELCRQRTGRECLRVSRVDVDLMEHATTIIIPGEESERLIVNPLQR
jgi:hypothetical protein